MACDYLAIQGSATPSARAFSSGALELPNATVSILKSSRPSNCSKVLIEMGMLVLAWMLKNTRLTSWIYSRLMVMSKWMLRGREKAARGT
ncbi:hypothetical protein BYT27DRAFT_6540360 [Phlegmacium glaucopus]|nr:hypothetical protein BYT27DRAFT_6540360 [Phlegmacium glaucopus]